MCALYTDEYVWLLQRLWSDKSAPVNPIKFKTAIGSFAPQFMGFNQHDCQEFLAFLLDGLHEELNTVRKKPYIQNPSADGRPDNVVAAEAWRLHLVRRGIFAFVCQSQRIALHLTHAHVVHASSCETAPRWWTCSRGN